MPHVMGEAGNIVAILWATRDALHSPSLQDRSNKILWVSRIPLVAPDPLVIKRRFAAQLSVGDAAVLLGVSKGRISQLRGGSAGQSTAAARRTGTNG